MSCYPSVLTLSLRSRGPFCQLVIRSCLGTNSSHLFGCHKVFCTTEGRGGSNYDEQNNTLYGNSKIGCDLEKWVQVGVEDRVLRDTFNIYLILWRTRGVSWGLGESGGEWGRWQRHWSRLPETVGDEVGTLHKRERKMGALSWINPEYVHVGPLYTSTVDTRRKCLPTVVSLRRGKMSSMSTTTLRKVFEEDFRNDLPRRDGNHDQLDFYVET